MKRTISILILSSVLTLVLATAQSCSVTTNTATRNEDTYQRKSEIEIRNTTFRVIQTMGKHEGLASDSNFDIVKIITNDEIIYDDKKLSGKWVLVDTYTYTTVKERVKTVPVFIPYKQYKEAIENGYHFSIYD